MDWQPIETAPKEMSGMNRGLLGFWFDPDILCGVVAIIHWRDHWTFGDKYRKCHPTHWMLLPEPPDA